MPDRMDTCASCRFYNAYPDMVEPNGQCRRRAPAVIDASWDSPAHGRQIETRAEFPQVMGKDWCGEYEARRG